MGARTPSATNRRQRQIERSRRRARRLGAFGFLLAAALPALLWHGTVQDVAQDFRWRADYLTGWTPWVLISGGLLFLAPVALSAGMHPDSRWYPRARNAYAGWGLTLYLLGCALATQVAQMSAGVVG